MDRLDKANIHAPVRETEAAEVTRASEETARAVYAFFKEKLVLMGGYSVSPHLAPENPDGSSARDPYVAFRRRTERMQTRKARNLQFAVSMWWLW